MRAPGRPDYVGETTYWDSAAGRLEYIYIENAGGVMRGTVESASGVLVFPATQYVEGGKSMTFRVRWTRLSDTSYEAWSEMQAEATHFKDDQRLRTSDTIQEARAESKAARRVRRCHEHAAAQASLPVIGICAGCACYDRFTKGG